MFVFPPCPTGKMRPGMLAQREGRGWVAQRKFDGTHVVIGVEAGRVEFRRKTGDKPAFELTRSLRDQLLSLVPDDRRYIFQAELLDGKSDDPRYKKRIVLFDLLFAGSYLFRWTLERRLELLADLCGRPAEREPAEGIALAARRDVWLAETFKADLSARYREFLHLDVIEGLMLKRAGSVLDNFGGKPYRVDWMIRCRKPEKAYSF